MEEDMRVGNVALAAAAAAACVMSLSLSASVHANDAARYHRYARDWNSPCIKACDEAAFPCFDRRFDNSEDSLRNEKICEYVREQCRKKCPGG
jgi:hypothetical protein